MNIETELSTLSMGHSSRFVRAQCIKYKVPKGKAGTMLVL